MRMRSGRAWVGFAALVVAAVALTLAVFALVYQHQMAPIRADTEARYQDLTRSTGLYNHASENVLDEDRYADANGDLVADAPANPAKQADPPELTFSYLAVDEDQGFKQAFAPLLAAISTATGKPVRYVQYHDAIDQLRDIRDDKLTLAGVNTGLVPLAVCRAGFVPLCQPADAGGNAGYKMLVIVPAASPIRSLADVAGHELTLTSPNSNSGYKAPLILLREAGLLPPKDYLFRYSGSQAGSIADVKAGTAQAAAVAGDVLTRERAAGIIKAADYRVVYTSDATFPSPAIGCGHDLSPALAAKVRDAMLGFDWAGTSLGQFYAAEGKVKFVPADYRKSWDYVRRLDDTLGVTYDLPAAARAAVAATRPATQP